MNIKHAHEWFRTVVEAGATSLLDDKRGKYKREEFYEMYHEIKLSARAIALEIVSSCNINLLKWGARLDNNKNRPYFEGRGRVVEARNNYVKYFLHNKELYFTKNPLRYWNRPILVFS